MTTLLSTESGHCRALHSPESLPFRRQIGLLIQPPPPLSMELSTVRALSNLPHHRLFNPSSAYLRRKTPLLLSHSWVSGNKLGLRHLNNTSLRARISEEVSSGFNQYPGEERDGVTAMKDVSPVEKSDFNETAQTESPNEESPVAEQMQGVEFLDKLNIKLDSKDANSILIYGSGLLVAVWLASAVVGAIDSIPVIPKLMELVGLAYSVWFSTRYLIFKKNRDELVNKLEEFRQQVLGLDD